jgi:hypothetical protein
MYAQRTGMDRHPHPPNNVTKSDTAGEVVFAGANQFANQHVEQALSVETG